jgi:predicted amidophosphoribosyltransferase
MICSKCGEKRDERGKFCGRCGTKSVTPSSVASGVDYRSAGGTDNRQVNEGIQSLQREKETALLSFGKIMHKIIRDKKINSDAYVQISERIAQIDAEINVLGGRQIPGQSDRICPNCKEMLAIGNDTFCGSCGTNVAEFYLRNTVRCEKCKQLTVANGVYCTVCGTKRAGGS